jgi:DNA-binding transcriptional MerR regulator
MNPSDGYWYSSMELAELLHVDASTIRRWRTSHPLQGPAFVKVSNRVYVYNSHDVEAWLASRRMDPGQAA